MKIISTIFCLLSLNGMVSQKNPFENNRLLFKEDFCVRAIGISKQHYLARMAHNNQTVYVYNLLNPHKRVLVFSNENGGIKTMDFDAYEHYLVTGSNSGKVTLWDLFNHCLISVHSLHNGSINELKFIPETSSFISVGSDGKLKLNKIENGALVSQLLGCHDGIIRGLDISTDGSFAATIANDGVIKVWNLSNKKLFISIETGFNDQNILNRIVFISDKTTLLTSDLNGVLYQINWKIKGIKKVGKIHNSIISTILPINSRMVLTTSYDGSIKKTDLTTGTSLVNYKNKAYIMAATLIDTNTVMYSDCSGKLAIQKLDTTVNED